MFYDKEVEFFFFILFRKELINCNQVRLLCYIISSLEIVVSMVENYILEKYTYIWGQLRVG